MYIRTRARCPSPLFFTLAVSSLMPCILSVRSVTSQLNEESARVGEISHNNSTKPETVHHARGAVEHVRDSAYHVIDNLRKLSANNFTLVPGTQSCNVNRGLGCKERGKWACVCPWYEHCYPRMHDTGDGDFVDIGVCNLAAILVVLISAVSLVSLLGIVILLRLYFQLAENEAEYEEIERAKKQAKEALRSRASKSILIQPTT